MGLTWNTISAIAACLLVEHCQQLEATWLGKSLAIDNIQAINNLHNTFRSAQRADLETWWEHLGVEGGQYQVFLVSAADCQRPFGASRPQSACATCLASTPLLSCGAGGQTPDKSTTYKSMLGGTHSLETIQLDRAPATNPSCSPWGQSGEVHWPVMVFPGHVIEGTCTQDTCTASFARRAGCASNKAAPVQTPRGLGRHGASALCVSDRWPRPALAQRAGFRFFWRTIFSPSFQTTGWPCRADSVSFKSIDGAASQLPRPLLELIFPAG